MHGEYDCSGHKTEKYKEEMLRPVKATLLHRLPYLALFSFCYLWIEKVKNENQKKNY